MMKKTTSALAIAALLGTGAASAATFQIDDSTVFSVSGALHYTYKTTTANGGTDTNVIDDGGSSVTFSGSHNSDNGLTTFFAATFDGIDGTTAGGDGLDTTDEAHIGVAGDFGSVKFGSESAVYDSIGDVNDVMYEGGVTSTASSDRSQVLQYSSPSLGIVSFDLEAVVNGDDDASNGTNDNDISLATSVEVALNNVDLTFAYDQNKAEGEIAEEEGEAFGFSVATSLQGIDLTAAYQAQSHDDPKDEVSIVSLGANYGYGAGNIYGVIQSVGYDETPTGESDDTFTEYLLGVDYAVAGNLNVYAEMQSLGRDDDDGDGYFVGAVLKF